MQKHIRSPEPFCNKPSHPETHPPPPPGEAPPQCSDRQPSSAATRPHWLPCPPRERAPWHVRPSESSGYCSHLRASKSQVPGQAFPKFFTCKRKLGESGWLSRPSIRLRLRSRSQDSGVRAPHWAHCCQRRACFGSIVPLSLPLPGSFFLSQK